MPGKTKKKATVTAKETAPEKPREKEIVFVCKFCGKTKPLSDMVIMRNLYPQVASCKECSKATKSLSE